MSTQTFSDMLQRDMEEASRRVALRVLHNIFMHFGLPKLVQIAKKQNPTEACAIDRAFDKKALGLVSQMDEMMGYPVTTYILGAVMGGKEQADQYIDTMAAKFRAHPEAAEMMLDHFKSNMPEHDFMGDMLRAVADSNRDDGHGNMLCPTRYRLEAHAMGLCNCSVAQHGEFREAIAP